MNLSCFFTLVMASNCNFMVVIKNAQLFIFDDLYWNCLMAHHATPSVSALDLWILIYL